MDPQAQSNAYLGSLSERVASRYLQHLGYTIVAHNVRLGRDEIDIIAYDPEDKVVVFAEVKARGRDDPDFRPELNLDVRKRKAISRAARSWVIRRKYQGGYRLDLICVVAGKVVMHLKELRWYSA